MTRKPNKLISLHSTENVPGIPGVLPFGGPFTTSATPEAVNPADEHQIRQIPQMGFINSVPPGMPGVLPFGGPFTPSATPETINPADEHQIRQIPQMGLINSFPPGIPGVLPFGGSFTPSATYGITNTTGESQMRQIPLNYVHHFHSHSRICTYRFEYRSESIR